METPGDTTCVLPHPSLAKGNGSKASQKPMFILQGNFHKQLCDLASIGWLTKTQVFLKLSPQSMAKIRPRTFSMAATM